jgi:peptide/nickel transport system substrate-binding protein
LLLSNLVQVPVYRRDDAGSLVGTGPYRLVSFDSKAVVLTAFPRYWGGAAALPSVHFVMTKRGEDTLAALSSGSIDLAEIPPRAVVGKPRPKFQVAASDGLRSVYLFLDSRPYEGNPVSDRRVREALSLGLDRAELARILTGHAETAATQLVPPTVFGFVPELKLPPRDVAAARLLLADADFQGLRYPVCRPEESDVAHAIARGT